MSEKPASNPWLEFCYCVYCGKVTKRSTADYRILVICEEVGGVKKWRTEEDRDFTFHKKCFRKSQQAQVD